MSPRKSTYIFISYIIIIIVVIIFTYECYSHFKRRRMFTITVIDGMIFSVVTIVY